MRDAATGAAAAGRLPAETLRTVAASVAIAGLLAVGAAVAHPSPASAGVANAGLTGERQSDPIAGMSWGNYSGAQDEVFPAYRAATGQNRRLLAKIALAPRVRWFGAWYDTSQIEQTIRDYIGNATGGNSDVLAQMAVFRLVPWEQAACRRLPTAAEQADYKQWIQALAAGIGSSRVAVILQPDLPFALCVPHHSTLPLQLVAFASRVLDALPYATVYIDAGAADWQTVGQAVRMLKSAGVGDARGFALNATHYDSTGHEIEFGARVARALAAAHVPGRHFVVNTASNGKPFTYQQYHGPDFNNAAVCRTPASTRCVTLGIPPTWQVTSSRWRLSARDRGLAARYVDGYLWYGRPWLDDQSDPFDLSRSLSLAATTPF
ncbi:MAG TPA: glycoside hydrolase family 6 protein [Solirubrobacteraceae bacterium]|nr:glycoside hydrolase family 6 protein [Solirubrobacteraceae bacterium]